MVKHFGTAKRQVHTHKCYCTVLKWNSQARTVCCLVCVIVWKQRQRWNAPSKCGFWTDASLNLCWWAYQYCFSMGKKQLASAALNILIFKCSKTSPFCSVFPPLLFATCNNEELWVFTLKENLSHPHKLRNVFVKLLQHVGEDFPLCWGLLYLAVSC